MNNLDYFYSGLYFSLKEYSNIDKYASILDFVKNFFTKPNISVREGIEDLYHDSPEIIGKLKKVLTEENVSRLHNEFENKIQEYGNNLLKKKVVEGLKPFLSERDMEQLKANLRAAEPDISTIHNIFKSEQDQLAKDLVHHRWLRNRGLKLEELNSPDFRQALNLVDKYTSEKANDIINLVRQGTPFDITSNRVWLAKETPRKLNRFRLALVPASVGGLVAGSAYLLNNNNKSEKYAGILDATKSLLFKIRNLDLAKELKELKPLYRNSFASKYLKEQLARTGLGATEHLTREDLNKLTQNFENAVANFGDRYFRFNVWDKASEKKLPPELMNTLKQHVPPQEDYPDFLEFLTKTKDVFKGRKNMFADELIQNRWWRNRGLSTQNRRLGIADLSKFIRDRAESDADAFVEEFKRTGKIPSHFHVWDSRPYEIPNPSNKILPAVGGLGVGGTGLYLYNKNKNKK